MADERGIRPSADPDPDDCPVSFLDRTASVGMDFRVVSIPGHGELAYEPADWAGSLVIVEEGEIELECRGGARACFGAGSVLFFDGLRLQAVRNSGADTALLSAVSRRETNPPANEPPTRRGLSLGPTAFEGDEFGGEPRPLDL